MAYHIDLDTFLKRALIKYWMEESTYRELYARIIHDVSVVAIQAPADPGRILIGLSTEFNSNSHVPAAVSWNSSMLISDDLDYAEYLSVIKSFTKTPFAILENAFENAFLVGFEQPDVLDFMSELRRYNHISSTEAYHADWRTQLRRFVIPILSEIIMSLSGPQLEHFLSEASNLRASVYSALDPSLSSNFVDTYVETFERLPSLTELRKFKQPESSLL